MGGKLNLTQAEIKRAKGIFEALPAATYGAVIFEAKDAVSKNSGNDMYTITYKITEGPAGVGRKFTSYVSHSAAAWFSARAFFKAIGRTDLIEAAEGGEEFEFPSIEDLEVLGEQVNVKLKVEEFDTVDDDDNDVKGQRNAVDRVFAYDEEKITTEEELESGSAGKAGKSGGKFIGL